MATQFGAIYHLLCAGSLLPFVYCFLCFLLQAENLLLDASGNIKIAGTYMAMLNMVVLVMMDLYVLCAPAF